MDFVQKSNFFLLPFLPEIIWEKDRFGLCGKKRMILRGKDWSFKKGKNWTLFKGVSPWFLSENRTFSYRCILQNLCQKRSFFYILERKQSFLEQKLEVLTRAKKCRFFKGVSPWIYSKNRNFSYGFFYRNCQKKIVFRYSG